MSYRAKVCYRVLQGLVVLRKLAVPFEGVLVICVNRLELSQVNPHEQLQRLQCTAWLQHGSAMWTSHDIAPEEPLQPRSW